MYCAFILVVRAATKKLLEIGMVPVIEDFNLFLLIQTKFREVELCELFLNVVLEDII